MMDKINEWIKEQNVTEDEIFKAFDRDFDGSISINDLKLVLTDVVKA